MLNKRTNILFDTELWQLLTTRAKQEDSSVGELVRQAVRATYIEDRALGKRQEIWQNILALRPSPKPTNYKELIHYGRKH